MTPRGPIGAQATRLAAAWSGRAALGPGWALFAGAGDNIGIPSQSRRDSLSPPKREQEKHGCGSEQVGKREYLECRPVAWPTNLVREATMPCERFERISSVANGLKLEVMVET